MCSLPIVWSQPLWGFLAPGPPAQLRTQHRQGRAVHAEALVVADGPAADQPLNQGLALLSEHVLGDALAIGDQLPRRIATLVQEVAPEAAPMNHEHVHMADLLIPWFQLMFHIPYALISSCRDLEVVLSVMSSRRPALQL